MKIEQLAKLLQDAKAFSVDLLDAVDYRTPEHLGLPDNLEGIEDTTVVLELFMDCKAGDGIEPDWSLSIEELLAGDIDDERGHVLTVYPDAVPFAIDLSFYEDKEAHGKIIHLDLL